MTKKIKLSELVNPKYFDKHKEDLLHYFEKGGTWQEALGYDRNMMEGEYKKAYDFYMQGDFQTASAAFTYLTTLNPYEYDYWMALGISKQAERSYEEALVSYTVAHALNEDHPLPHLHLAQCYLAIQQKELMLEHLQKTIETASDKEEFKDIKYKAQVILKNLSK